MQKPWHTEEQVIGTMKQAAVGMKVADVIRKRGISEQAHHRWMSKCGGLEVGEANRLKHLDDDVRNGFKMRGLNTSHPLG